MTPVKTFGLFDSRLVGPLTARRYGLDVRPLLSPREVAGIVQVENLWLETSLPGDPAWTVAYRIALQDGRAVVAELRVFPTESDVPNREPGSWRGEWLGRKAPVPAGGLTTRAVRSIRVGQDVQSLANYVDEIRKEPDLRWFLDPKHGWLGHLGITDSLKIERPRAVRPGRGRPTLPARAYLDVATAYAAAVERGSRSPIQDVAATLAIPVSTVRARIHTARRLGFLDPGRQGHAGGQLMPAARRLLQKTRLTKKGSRHGKTRTR
jgi:hypothetical protein